MLDDLDLQHIAMYDPVKAHEYYLRVRQLKGRQPGKGVQAPTGHRSAAVKSTKKLPNQKRQAVEAQVVALQARLEHLREVLAKLVEKAKARSGVETRTEKAKRQATNAQESKGSSPLSAEQRQKADQRSKDYRKTHPSVLSPNAEVAQLQKQIAAIRIQIENAIEAAQTTSTKRRSDHVNKSNSKTAAKAVSTH